MSCRRARARSFACMSGTSPRGIFCLSMGWVIWVRFRSWYAEMIVFRALWESVTTPAVEVKCEGESCRRLTSESVMRSGSTGRSSSIMSSASEGLPGRGVCRNPSCGSSPMESSACVQSLSSSEYSKESIAFVGLRGGLRVRLSKEKNCVSARIIRWKVLK